jgi:hypothetical protein
VFLLSIHESASYVAPSVDKNAPSFVREVTAPAVPAASGSPYL